MNEQRAPMTIDEVKQYRSRLDEELSEIVGRKVAEFFAHTGIRVSGGRIAVIAGTKADVRMLVNL